MNSDLYSRPVRPQRIAVEISGGHVLVKLLHGLYVLEPVKPKLETANHVAHASSLALGLAVSSQPARMSRNLHVSGLKIPLSP